jgi:hypothetical protein
VIRFETIRVAIYFAIQRGWVILQYDVKTAFLHGELKEEVLMEQPAGYEMGGLSHVCKLIKSLYGLRQAPHVWNQKLHEHLVAIGFRRLESDYGLYARHNEGEVSMLLTVYVDDLLLMGTPADCEEVRRLLQAAFELVDLGPVKYLLGVELIINKIERTVFYSQETYIHEVLKRFGMQNSNGAPTPEGTSTATPRTKEVIRDMPYREVVGALQYLVSGSRPDIAHAVRKLGQFMSCYTAEHYSQAKRVLRYLKATSDYGLLMVVHQDRVIQPVHLTVYTDADYANDTEDRKSVSGYVTLLDGATVSYGSRKQGINALSTMDAEYYAMHEGTKDIQWLKKLCEELRIKYETPRLLSDNMAAIYLSEKPGKHHHVKHIENKYHYVRSLVQDKKLRTEYINTEEQVADVMTKALARVKFTKFRAMLVVAPRRAATSTKAERFQILDENAESGGAQEEEEDESVSRETSLSLWVGFE